MSFTKLFEWLFSAVDSWPIAEESNFEGKISTISINWFNTILQSLNFVSELQERSAGVESDAFESLSMNEAEEAQRFWKWIVDKLGRKK